ncbi:hypothetical protein GETHOR_04950 [Geothrix oryzae]|uniref:Uncharacterized protein n=1 Tax=Geothrix oryzae TaxID=2927975 RepID=A0ABN6UUH1_9BACT|nr:DUF3788 family protein [Geothrix oryzae]BDU68394.1 hypothetical protein GETHOR_04950 [Geothrix oryzae]
MAVNPNPPSTTELKGVLGPALAVWHGVLSHARATHAPLVETWKPSKTEFGRMCLLQQKKRTLLYLTPDQGKVWVAVILGERAFHLALASSLPGGIKKLLLEARPYAEGRGIRFAIHSPDELASIVTLLDIKTALS